MILDFKQQLKMSSETNGRCLEQIIQDMLPGVVSVQKSDTKTDKTGIDYIATLRRGATVFIDTKKREKGCSFYWKNGEEIALERWSVIGEKTGWTLDESKLTHYTLHLYDPSDSQKIFLFPFQLLRKAFVQNCNTWFKTFSHAIQDSGSWRSECVFVPAKDVMDSITIAMSEKEPK